MPPASSVIRLLERRMPVAKRPDFLGREIDAHRREPVRLHEQVAVLRVVHLVEARRALHERGLFGIGVVVDERRSTVFDPEVSVQAARQFDEVGGGVLVELALERAIRDAADGREENAEDDGVEDRQARAERKGHGHARQAGGLSVRV